MDAVRTLTKDYSRHVVQRAAAGMRLRVDQSGAILASTEQRFDHLSRFKIQDLSISIDCALIQPAEGDPTVFAPSVVVRSGGYSTAREHCLGLDEHFFSGREDISIRHHEVFHHGGIRNDYEQLVPEPDGIKLAKFLGPVVQREFRIVGQG